MNPKGFTPYFISKPPLPIDLAEQIRSLRAQFLSTCMSRRAIDSATGNRQKLNFAANLTQKTHFQLASHASRRDQCSHSNFQWSIC